MYPVNLDGKKKNGEFGNGNAFLGESAHYTNGGDALSNDSSNNSESGDKFKWDGTWGYDESKVGKMWQEPFDPAKSEERFKNSFKNFMAPKDTPERRRSQFALSESALNNVVGDFYENELKGRFKMKRDDSKKRGRDEYMRYAGVVGGNPEDAMYQAMRVDNPKTVIDETMHEIDNDKLYELVAPLASYGGYNVKEYAEKFVKPLLRDRMINEYVEENKPRSSAEYVLRSSLDNSLMGKVGKMALNGRLDENTHTELSGEGLARYSPSRLENFASGVGSLIVDMPVFSGIGSSYGALFGRGVKWATKKIAGNIMARNTSRYMTSQYADRIAKRYIMQNLSTKMLQGSLGQGLTLGTYDVANSVADDILYGEGIDVGKAAGSFARGLFTGGAAGAIGVPLRKASAGLTGGKKLLSSAGVLSAESAVFTASGEIEKVINGVDIEPVDLLYDYAESTATLLAMKMTNWRPRGAELKLDANGKIKENFKLTDVEKKELRAIDISPEDFLLSIEMELKLPSFGGGNAEKIKQQYIKLMTSKDISASTRSKLMFLVENKLTSIPPVAFDYTVEKKDNGSWFVTTIDTGGHAIKKYQFSDYERAKSFLILERGNIRRNRIAMFEKELTDGVNSQNFLRQAGIYAREKGVDVNKLSEVLYNKANGEKLNAVEDGLVNDILTRTAYDETGMVQFLHDARKAIEKKYNLPEGSLMTVVDKKFYECSNAQNKALDEYEVLVRTEVDRLKNGTADFVATEMAERGRNSNFRGMSNEQVKEMEIAGYESFLKEQEAERANGTSTQRTLTANDASKKVWSPELVEELKTHMPRLTKMFRHDIKIITRPEDIPLPKNPNDSMDVMDYNNQMEAQGWYINGEVYINLMNIKSVKDLECTVVHEVVTHSGLERIFGNYYNEFLEEVYRRADKYVREQINRQRGANPTYDVLRCTEEYLASLSEKVYLNSRERTMMRRFKDFVKNMLVRLNIYTGDNRYISEKELMEIIRLHTDYIIKGKETSYHRRKVFRRFDSASHAQEGYADRNSYANDIRRRIQDGTYFNGTPDGVLNQKLESAYYTLGQNDRWMLSDLIKRRKAENESRRDDVRYRFIGKKGAESLAGNENGLEENYLKKARTYEDWGYTPQKIKRYTGWERGADDQWRYEQPEDGMLLKDVVLDTYFANDVDKTGLYLQYKNTPYRAWPKELKNMWERTNGIRNKEFALSDVVADDKLFAAYPDFANIPVKVLPNMPEMVFYNGKQKKLYVNRDLFLMENPERHMAGAIQNIIQDYENFSKAVPYSYVVDGGDRYKKEYLDAKNAVSQVRKLRGLIPDFDSKSDMERIFLEKYGAGIDDFDNLFPTYDEFLLYKQNNFFPAFSGNVEVENVKRRFGMKPYERMYTPASATEPYPRRKQMVIRNIDDINKYFSGPLDIIKNTLDLYMADTPFKTDKRLPAENMSADDVYLLNKGIEKRYGPIIRDEWKTKSEKPRRHKIDRVFDDETGEYYDLRKKYKDYLPDSEEDGDTYNMPN